jgi:hypothetical protein
MNFYNNQNIHIGISQKKDGPMKSSLENRLSFFKQTNLDTKITVSAGLIHENKVIIIDDILENTIIPNCDALITNNDKCLLTITTADCLPIYFYDKNKNVVAIAHAGWRGVVSKIAEKVINQFMNHYHSDINDIEVSIGPHIKDCHFEIKDDAANQFKKSDLIIRGDKIYIDLSQIIKNQLNDLGVNNIEISEDCTYCLSDKYFSYRRDNPKELETMIAYIGLK